jgi:hypothetical protein
MADEVLIGAGIIGGLALVGFVAYEMTRPSTNASATSPAAATTYDCYPTANVQSFNLHVGDTIQFHYDAQSGYTGVTTSNASTWSTPTTTGTQGQNVASYTATATSLLTGGTSTFTFQGNPQATGTIGTVSVTVS